MKEEGNYNSIQDFNNMLFIDMNEVGTFRDFYNKLRSLTHEPYSNAYIKDENGEVLYLKIVISTDRNQDK
jgi:hypothetical protein